MFTDFRVARYEVVLEVGPKGLLLPPYKGSTLRGGFGHVFRRICCSQTEAVCSQCMLAQACAYGQIFEPSPPASSAVLKNLSDIPRPFVIEPPLETKTQYMLGEQLRFGLVLIGQAIQYLPYFVLTFKELGNIGLGKGRLPFVLAEFRAVMADGRVVPVYNRETNMVTPVNTGVTLGELTAGKTFAASELWLNFITMTRLKYDHSLVTTVPFHVLIRNLLRRVSTLYYFFHGYRQEDVDYRQLIAQAEMVDTIRASLRLVDWERYSHRQETKMNMGGLVGEIVYAGDIAPFWPLLKLGEVIHVGKGCVFGLGKYEVKNEHEQY